MQNYLNFYVFSKLAWDGKIDVEAVLVDTDKNGWEGWGLMETAGRQGTAVVIGCAGDKTYVGFALCGASALKPNAKYRLSYFIRTRPNNGTVTFENNEFSQINDDGMNMGTGFVTVKWGLRYTFWLGRT